MRIKTVTVFLTLATLLHSQEVSENKDLVALRGNWSKARQQAVTPIDNKYATALVALKDKLMKAGNLDGARQVDAELKKISVELGEFQPKLEQVLVGEWEMRTSEGWTSPYELLENGGVRRPENGNPTKVATWSVSQDGKTLYLRYRSEYGATDKFDLPPVNGVITGTNDRKVVLTLTKHSK